MLQIPQEPYRAWTVREEDFPRTGSLEEQARFLVGYGILSANSHNTQPWQFRVVQNAQEEGAAIEIIPDLSRALPHSDPQNRELFVSLGCVLGTLRVAALHFGLAPQVSFCTESSHPSPTTSVARLSLKQGIQSDEHAALFTAIADRRINRFPYDRSRAIDPETIEAFRRLNDDEQLDLCLITDQELQQSVLDLVERSTMATQGMPEIVKEWTRWMRTPFTRRYDGLPLSEDFGMKGLQTLVAPLLFRFAKPEKEAERTRSLFATAPVLFAITSQGNAPEQWMRAGMLLTYLNLAATAKGIALAPWGAVVEHEESAQAFSALLHTGRPLFFGRLGYAIDGPPHHSPRRPAKDVLVSG